MALVGSDKKTDECVLLAPSVSHQLIYFECFYYIRQCMLNQKNMKVLH